MAVPFLKHNIENYQERYLQSLNSYSHVHTHTYVHIDTHSHTASTKANVTNKRVRIKCIMLLPQNDILLQSKIFISGSFL